MPARDEHLRSAQRFEGFLGQINHPQQPYREWVVIVWFHIALHYVDAFLATKGHPQIEGHSDRWAKMANEAETRSIQATMLQLYKDAKEARYQATEFAPLDLRTARYNRVRQAMRGALGLG
ncbi:MAG: hypothetical protein HYU51_19295 [Candidatus Rokubacteria bacterium]|nr:hypothetical protein [Candidatus Rokubacteria bacterium]